MNIIKTIVMALVASAVALLLAACSESPAEGCWITHANDVELSSQVPLPGDGEALAMNPGASYQIRCARKIDDSSVGYIFSQDQQTLRIDALPHDAEIQIYPNERDTVYRGQPVSSSANVWNAFEEASGELYESWFMWVPLVIAVIIAVVGGVVFLLRQRGKLEDEPDAIPRF